MSNISNTQSGRFVATKRTLARAATLAILSVRGTVRGIRNRVRAGIKTMFKSIYQVYPASKFAPYLMDGIKHKNSKLRTECLDELGWMIRNHGMSVLQTPAACLKEMAKSISGASWGYLGAS